MGTSIQQRSGEKHTRIRFKCDFCKKATRIALKNGLNIDLNIFSYHHKRLLKQMYDSYHFCHINNFGRECYSNTSFEYCQTIEPIFYKRPNKIATNHRTKLSQITEKLQIPLALCFKNCTFVPKLQKFWQIKYTNCSAVSFRSILTLSLHFPDEPKIIILFWVQYKIFLL